MKYALPLLLMMMIAILAWRLDTDEKRIEGLERVIPSGTIAPDNVIAGGATFYVNGKYYLPLLVPCRSCGQ